MLVNHATIAAFNKANMSFNAIREDKIIAKISEFTVSKTGYGTCIFTDFYTTFEYRDQLKSI